MVGLRRAWHDITTFGQHTRSKDVSRGMPSSPLSSTHGRMTSAWHAIIAHGRQTQSNDVRRDMPSPLLDSIHGRTTSGVACHHRLWAAHTVEQRRTLHAIIAFGKHTRSDDIGHAMTSPPLDSTHGRIRRAWNDDIIALAQHARSPTSGVA